MKEINVLEGKVVAPEGLKVGIVAARFNEIIVNKLLGGAVDGLVRHGVEEDNITAAGVPARVVKKDGVAVPRHSGESLPEEFREELEKRLDKFEKEMKDIKQKLSDLPSAGSRSEGFSEQGGG